MTKKEKKGSDDNSIPVRVTQAKNAARTAQTIARNEDHIEQRKKSGTIPRDLGSLLNFGGKKMDMTRLDQGNSRRRLLIRITLIVLVLFALAFAGFWVFTQNAKKFGQDIQFSIEVPQDVASGQVVTLLVNYTNNESIDLQDAEVTMQFPDGFRFQSSTPATVAPNAWSVGDLEAGGGGVISIRGQLVGDVGSVKLFSALLTYTPSNFNYAFEEEATASVTIGSSVLSLDIDAPIRVTPGTLFDGTITYTNTSEEDLNRVRVQLVTPSGFTLESSDPEEDQLTWTVDTLATDEEQKISFTGTLDGDVGSQPQFTVRIGFVDAQENFNLQAEQTFLVLLIKAGVTMDVQASYDEGDDYAEWGDTITYTVSYKNDGDVPIENARLVLDLVSESSSGTSVSLVDWNNITSPDKGVLEDTSIVWKSSDIDSLSSVKPGDEGTFSVIVPLQDDPAADDESKKEFVLRATSKVFSGNDAEPISVSQPQESKIATAVTFSSQGRYYSDSLDELGSGPIPPEVGETTTYVIYWNIKNTTNDIQNVTVSTTLPSSVSWQGDTSISAGDPLSFNPQTREVTWNINRIPAGAGVSFAQLEASFTVSITPTVSDEGNTMTLLSASSVSATDTYTGASRSAGAGVVTTDIPQDPGASGQGVVVDPTS